VELAPSGEPVELASCGEPVELAPSGELVRLAPRAEEPELPPPTVAAAAAVESAPEALAVTARRTLDAIAMRRREMSDLGGAAVTARSYCDLPEHE
jgi:hypothetical protein